MRAFVRRLLLEPMLEQLRQGTSPEALATSMAWGLALGVCPLWGLTTSMGAVAGIVFKLNHAALQSVNYLAYPLQIALLVPFLKLGDWAFGINAPLYSISALKATYDLGAIPFATTYGLALARAGVAWALVVPVPALLVRRAALPVIRALAERLRRART